MRSISKQLLMTMAFGVLLPIPAIADNADLQQLQKRIEDLEKQRPAEEKSSNWVLNSEAMQFYGQLRVSVDNHSGDWKAGTKGTSIVSNASRIGVKGAIPSGLLDSSVIYLGEVRYESTDAVDGTAGKQLEFREGYAGLASPTWGKIRLGRLDTAYKTTLTELDPWGDNAPESRSGGRQGSSELHASYFNNAADYVTPEFVKGLTGSAWYASEFDNAANSFHNTTTLKTFTGGSASGLGVKYSIGPFFIGADYINLDADKITKTGLTNANGWQIGSRYKIKDFSVAAFYEDTVDLGLGKNIYINGIYKLGKARLIAAYGTNKDGSVYSNDKYINLSLGGKYDLDKKSELFAAYNTRQNDTKNTEENTITIGLNAKFGY